MKKKQPKKRQLFGHKLKNALKDLSDFRANTVEATYSRVARLENEPAPPFITKDDAHVEKENTYECIPVSNEPYEGMKIIGFLPELEHSKAGDQVKAVVSNNSLHKEKTTVGLSTQEIKTLRDMSDIRNANHEPVHSRIADYKKLEDTEKDSVIDDPIVTDGQLVYVNEKQIHTGQDLADAIVAAHGEQSQLYGFEEYEPVKEVQSDKEKEAAEEYNTWKQQEEEFEISTSKWAEEMSQNREHLRDDEDELQR